MPKYLCFTRTSPGTENDGLGQQTRILIGLEILHEHGEIKPYENSDLEFYNARDVARSELMDSVVVYKLFNTIDTADPDEEIVVVVAQIDRLGIQYNNICFFLDYVLDRTCKNNKVRFMSIKEYGLNPFDVAQAISRFYAARLHQPFYGQTFNFNNHK